MYGLVNRAIEGLVKDQFGNDKWNAICERAGVEVSEFVAMVAYDDAITYGLVGAASEELGLEPAEVLEAFGQYWTSYTIDQGYGEMLSAMGSTLDEFLDNLNQMHGRISFAMPELVPPSFHRERQEDGSSILYYESTREGLAPMAIGVLKGLAKRFNTELHIEHLPPIREGEERFHLRQRC